MTVNRLTRGVALAFAVAVLPAGGLAQTESCVAGGGSTQLAVGAVDGATITLDDGRPVRLAGVLPPSRPLDISDDVSWPIEETARRALAGLVANRRVRLVGKRGISDRHGRTIARVYREDGLWIGGEMIAAGLVRAGIDGGPCRGELFRREETARALRRGVWSLPAYELGHAGDPDLARRAGRYAVVEGRVLSVGEGRTVVFLNFGRNWRKDFTAMLYGTKGRAWKAAGFDPVKLAGRTVRIRGWLEARNGALIRVSWPEQIERLDDNTSGEAGDIR